MDEEEDWNDDGSVDGDSNEQPSQQSFNNHNITVYAVLLMDVSEIREVTATIVDICNFLFK